MTEEEIERVAERMALAMDISVGETVPMIEQVIQFKFHVENAAEVMDKLARIFGDKKVRRTGKQRFRMAGRKSYARVRGR